MKMINLLLILWYQNTFGTATKGFITTTAKGETFAAVYYNDTISIYKLSPAYDSIIIKIADTTGTFSISSTDSATLLVKKENSNTLGVFRIIHGSLDTFYNILTPSNIKEVKLYNDGYIHPFSYPVWYLALRSDSNILISHSANFGASFYPFDTVISLPEITAFDFTTTTNGKTDRLHFAYALSNGYLFLRNGSYPSSFTDTIQIDSMIPDLPHVSISGKGDTLIIVYERISSQTLPDIDIYAAISYFEGHDIHYDFIAVSTNNEIYPVITKKLQDSFGIHYIEHNDTSLITETFFTPPYTAHSHSNTLFSDSFERLYGASSEQAIVLLAITYDNRAIFMQNLTTSIKEHFFKSSYIPRKDTGIFTIDGRKIRKITTNNPVIIKKHHGIKKVIYLR